MNITVFGSTGGTGRAVVSALLAAGHVVTAFARDPTRVATSPRCASLGGDAMSPKDVLRSLAKAEAAVVSLGNSQNPFALRLGATRTTPPDICEVGTRNIVTAMRAHGVERLVVVSAYGVGETRALPSRMTKVFFRLVLSEHMADKEKQEILIKSSGLDWTIAQPVALTDSRPTGQWFASPDGTVRKAALSRTDLAGFIVGEIDAPTYLRKTVTLSG